MYVTAYVIHMLFIVDGLTEAEITKHESDFNMNIPLELKCSYRIHDGQNTGSSTG